MINTVALVPFLIFVALYGVYKVVVNRRALKVGVTKTRIPGPAAFFPTGIRVWRLHPTRFHHYIHDLTVAYGDVCQFFLGAQPVLVVADADLLKQIIAKSKNFILRQYPPLFDVYLKNKGILFTNDIPRWKVHRAAALNGMMKPKHLREVVNWTSSAVHRCLERWQHNASKGSFEVDIDEEMNRIALDVICRAAFGIDAGTGPGGSDIHEIHQIVRIVMLASTKFNRFPPFIWKFYRPKDFIEAENAVFRIHDMMLRIIAERKAEMKTRSPSRRYDLLDILLRAREDEQQSSKTPSENSDLFSDESIAFTCQDLFLAGHETTSHTVAWACMLLAQNKHIQDRARDEALSVSNGNVPSYEDIVERMVYITAVVKETLRLYPTVPLVTKKPVEDDVIAGIPIAKNTPVFLSVWRMHRHERYWTKPLEFIPERWLDGGEYSSVNGVDSDGSLPARDGTNENALPYLPFGIGARSCIGSRMAMLEARLILAMLLMKYDMDIPEGVANSVQSESTITLRPVGLTIRCTPR